MHVIQSTELEYPIKLSQLRKLLEDSGHRITERGLQNLIRNGELQATRTSPGTVNYKPPGLVHAVATLWISQRYRR